MGNVVMRECAGWMRRNWNVKSTGGRVRKARSAKMERKPKSTGMRMSA